MEKRICSFGWCSLLLGAEKGMVCLCEFVSDDDDDLLSEFSSESLSDDGEDGAEADISALNDAERQLGEYFAGKRKAFSVPVRLEGTEFQKKVWDELMKVPFGELLTYGSLARRVGNLVGARAVAQACSKNPVSIIVPCHRIISAGGKMGGYAGGVNNKLRLLMLEDGAYEDGAC